MHFREHGIWEAKQEQGLVRPIQLVAQRQECVPLADVTGPLAESKSPSSTNTTQENNKE